MPSTMSPARPATPPAMTRAIVFTHGVLSVISPGKPAQCFEHRAGTRPAFRRVRRQRARDQLDERHRQIGPVFEERPPPPGLVRIDQIQQRPALDGILPGDEVVEQHANGVDVALHRGRLAVEHFRRHIDGRADDVAGSAIATGRVVTGPEVHQHDLPGLVAHHVLGLHVAMHVARGMNGGERPADILAHTGRLAVAQPAARPQDARQRLAGDELHAQPDAVAVCLDAEHLHHVGVLHLRQRPALAQQPLAQPIVLDLRVEDLDRDVPLELRIPGAVHAPEAAGAELPHQAIAPPAFMRLGDLGGRHRARRPAAVVVDLFVRRSVHVGEIAEHLQPLQLGTLVVRSRQAVQRRPVHRRAVGDAVDGPGQDVVSRHGASPRPGA